MNILIYGGGAMGSYLAAKLRQGGNRVLLIARGDRLKELEAHGLKLVDADTGMETSEKAELAAQPPADFSPDYIMTAVQAHQMEEVLASISAMPTEIPLLWLGALVKDMDLLMERCPGRQVLCAYPGTTAVIESDGTVLYLEQGEGEREQWGMSLGALEPREASHSDGEAKADKDATLTSLQALFEQSGLASHIVAGMRSVLLSQSAVRVPILSALYSAGGSLDQLYGRGDLLKLMILGIREALAAIKAQGSEAVPKSLEMYRWVPTFISANMIKHRFNTLSSRIGIESFSRNAFDETAHLASQLLDMAEQAATPNQHLLYLFSIYEEREA